MEPKLFVARRNRASTQRESARLGSEKRCRPASASSPPSWKKFDAKHREAPTNFTGPPRKRAGCYSKWKRTSMRVCGRKSFEADVQLPVQLAWPLDLERNMHRKSGSKSAALQKRKCNNTLALATSCGRLAAFTAPLSDFRDVCAAAVGRAENFYTEVALHGPRSEERRVGKEC